MQNEESNQWPHESQPFLFLLQINLPAWSIKSPPSIYAVNTNSQTGLILVLLAMGTLVYATWAASASSEIQEDNQETVKELDLIN